MSRGNKSWKKAARKKGNGIEEPHANPDLALKDSAINPGDPVSAPDANEGNIQKIIEEIESEHGEVIEKTIAEVTGKLKKQMKWALEAQNDSERQKLIAGKKIDYVKLAEEINEAMLRIDGSKDECKEAVLLKMAKEELEGNKIKQYQNYISSAVSSHFRGEQGEELGKFLATHDELLKNEKKRKKFGSNIGEAGDVVEKMKPVESDTAEKLFEKAGIQEARESLTRNSDSLSPNEQRIVDFKIKALFKASEALSKISKLPEEDVEYFREEWLIQALNIYRDTIKSIDDFNGKAQFDAQFPFFVEETASESGFDEKGVESIVEFYREAIKIEDLLAKS